jgi:choline dehydrogenase-like flavoprotein
MRWSTERRLIPSRVTHEFLGKPGRFAGFLYVLAWIPGFFALAYVPSKLLVHGDATTTPNHIVAHETFLRRYRVRSHRSGHVYLCGSRPCTICSRASTPVASDNFQDAAVIEGNYLGADHDFAAIVRAIEAAREIGNQHAFESLRESELIPGPKASAEEIRELARLLATASFGHAVGTCKMGVDKLSVVDPERRVHGILGLRVADASVRP